MSPAARGWKFYPATAAGVLAILQLGVVWGLLLQRSAWIDAACVLEPELSEAAYEDYVESRVRPPASEPALAVWALVLVSLFYLVYELLRGALRRALEAAAGKLAWLRVSRPDATAAEVVRRARWPRAIGKILLIAVVSLLWASQDARRRAERLEATGAAAVEREAGSSQPADDPPPATPQNQLRTGILSTALFVGVYEFAGVFVASVAAWAAGAALPLGTHLWLSTAGWPLLLLGSLYLLMVVGQLGQGLLGEAPGWLKLVLGVLGVLAAVSGVERFIKAIPVPCPECGGQAFQTSGKPIVYECRGCRHDRIAGSR